MRCDAMRDDCDATGMGSRPRSLGHRQPQKHTPQTDSSRGQEVGGVVWCRWWWSMDNGPDLGYLRRRLTGTVRAPYKGVRL